MPEGISDAICAHAAAMRYEALPAATIAAAKRVLLDASGVIVAASGIAPEAEPFLNFAAATGAGPCRVLGTPILAAPAIAALVNGALAHALDYEDAFDDVPGHPNASLVPALITLAQMGQPIDGRRFLTALAVGSDIACRVGLGLARPVDELGWYAPPVIASLGSAIGAAQLLGLDAQQIKDSLSLMLCQSTMPGEIRYSRRTVLRAVREGFPAQAAVISSLLAREGVAGFEAPLEGKGGFYALFAGGAPLADQVLAELGERFWIEQLTFKPWPSCRATHSFIEMALALRARHGLTSDDVVSVEIQHDEFQEMLLSPLERKRAPQFPIDAKFSIPFCTALALHRGKVGLDDFATGRLRDPAILSVAARVSHRRLADAGWSMGAGGGIELTLRDGRRCAARQDNALGCPAQPLSDRQLTDKFIECVGRGRRPLEPKRAQALAERIMTLESCRDVGALFSW